MQYGTHTLGKVWHVFMRNEVMDTIEVRHLRVGWWLQR